MKTTALNQACPDSSTGPTVAHLMLKLNPREFCVPYQNMDQAISVNIIWRLHEHVLPEEYAF